MKYLIIIMLGVVNLFALVSIAPVDIGDNPGITGVINGSLNTNRGNTESDNYSTGMKLSYDNNKSYLMWGEFDYSYGEASGVKNENSIFLHIRYIHKLKQDFDWEAFTQLQSNEFTRINERFLAGGGLRIHSNKKPYGNIYFGFGAFYEYLNYSTTTDPTQNNIRGNFYLAYKKDFTKDTQLSDMVYYQPKIGDVSDYIILNALELNIKVYKKLYISFLINYNKDSKPAQGVKSVDFSQTTSFIYKF